MSRETFKVGDVPREHILSIEHDAYYAKSILTRLEKLRKATAPLTQVASKTADILEGTQEGEKQIGGVKEVEEENKIKEKEENEDEKEIKEKAENKDEKDTEEKAEIKDEEVEEVKSMNEENKTEEIKDEEEVEEETYMNEENKTKEIKYEEEDEAEKYMNEANKTKEIKDEEEIQVLQEIKGKPEIAEGKEITEKESSDILEEETDLLAVPIDEIVEQMAEEFNTEYNSGLDTVVGLNIQQADIVKETHVDFIEKWERNVKRVKALYELDKKEVCDQLLSAQNENSNLNGESGNKLKEQNQSPEIKTDQEQKKKKKKKETQEMSPEIKGTQEGSRKKKSKQKPKQK